MTTRKRKKASVKRVAPERPKYLSAPPDNDNGSVDFHSHVAACKTCSYRAIDKLCGTGRAAWWRGVDGLAVGDAVALLPYDFAGEITEIDRAEDPRPVRVAFVGGSSWWCFPGELAKR